MDELLKSVAERMSFTTRPSGDPPEDDEVEDSAGDVGSGCNTTYGA